MKKVKISKVLIIGAGLAGSECGLVLSNFDQFCITIIDQKPTSFSSCHHNKNFGELVCSNSLRSKNETNGAGLIKAELSLLNSPLLKIAYQNEINTGDSLVVDRNNFSKDITNELLNKKNITVINQKLDQFNINFSDYDFVVIAVGPATSTIFYNSICDYLQSENRYFIDGSAPLINADSINYSKTFWQNRFDKEAKTKYLNCPLTKKDYDNLVDKLISVSTDANYLDDPLFQGCMPVELIARTGKDSLRFGPLKPIGLGKHLPEKPYAVVQLRQDDNYKTLFNIVGFQTGLSEPAQKQVLQLIPGLEKVTVAKYGRLHNSLYIDSPRVLTKNYKSIFNDKLYFAGQINGIEGYVEAIASGHLIALDIIFRFFNKKILFPDTTMIASLMNYATNPTISKYIPIKSNFGILPTLSDNCQKDQKKLMLCQRSKQDLTKFIEDYKSWNKKNN